jgi:hypothetical protein
MINEPWFVIIMIFCVLGFIGKCLEMKYYHDKFRLLREEIILENTNYIQFNDSCDNS